MAEKNVEKSHTPSIWSFDSGYASHTGLDALTDADGDLRLDDFCEENPQVQPPNTIPAAHPTQSKLHVFTNLGPSSSSPSSFVLPEIQDDHGGCLQCAFWEITNPGGNIRCEECLRVPNIEVEVVEPDQLILNRHTEKGLATFKALDIRRKEDKVPTRCSACELARLIDATGKATCGSCITKPESSSATTTNYQNSDSSFEEFGNALGGLSKITVEPTASPDPSLLSPISPRSPVSPSSKVRRSRAGRSQKLPLSALNRLQSWLDAHQDNPYPNADEKKQLALDCGITEKQVTTWFTNARARKLNPLERWASSGNGSEDEGEGVREEDIARAAADGGLGSGLGLGPGLAESGFTYLSSNGLSTPATSPYRQAASVTGSSAFSGGPGRAASGTTSRRGKKKDYRRSVVSQTSTIEFGNCPSPISPVGQQTSHPAPQQPSSEPAPLQPDQETWECTFCRQALAPKSWRRHEETQHRPRSQWTCMLYGPRLSFPARANPSPNGQAASASVVNKNRSSKSYCAFCMEESPPESHFQTHHRIPECAKRAPAERTFYRPDHLRQHVRNFHTSKLQDIAQVRWKTNGKGGDSEGAEDYVCGFCGEKLSSWDKRETHISAHFKDGWTMERWQVWPQPDTPSQLQPNLRSHGKKAQKEKPQTPESSFVNRLSRTFSFGRKLKGSQPSNTPRQSCDMDISMGDPGAYGNSLGFVPQSQSQQAFMDAPLLTTNIDTEPMWSECDVNDMSNWNFQLPVSTQQYLPISSGAGVMDMDMTGVFDPSMTLPNDFIPDLPPHLGNQIDYHGPWRQS